MLTYIFIDFNVVNNPVHIMTEDNQVSLSSFIPFCEFGMNMSSMGLMKETFSTPVCNSFKSEVLNDQICYTVDLNRFSSGEKTQGILESGLAFIMDYNEDRQVTFDHDFNTPQQESLVNRVVRPKEAENAYIHLDTIGENFSKIYMI